MCDPSDVMPIARPDKKKRMAGISTQLDSALRFVYIFAKFTATYRVVIAQTSALFSPFVVT